MLHFFIDFIDNLTFIAGGIVAFSSPFLILFYIRNRKEIRDKRPHFNQFMELFMTSRESNGMILCWALAEALFWFVIPEFLLLLVVFMKVRHKSQLLIYDLIGTIVGTILGLTLRMPDPILLRMPYIFQNMLVQTDTWYRDLGTFALIHQPFSGVPYKVFLAHAPQMSLGAAILFILFAIVIRISRYAIGYTLFTTLFPILHRFVYRNYIVLLVSAVAIFSLLLMRVVAIYS